MNWLSKLTGLFLILAVAHLASGQPTVNFEKGGLDSAMVRSKKENKLVFFLCYASWCSHCAHMKDVIMKDSQVAAFFNKQFICAAMDMESANGADQRKRFAIRSYPTFIFFDSAGNTVYRTTGEFTPEAFINEGKNALNKKKQLPYLKQQFEKDVSKPNHCLPYLKALKAGDLDYSDVVKRYFATQKDKQLLSEINWSIIANGVTDIDSREFQFVLSHQKEFAEIASPQRVERKIFHLIKELLIPMVDANDSARYWLNRPKAASIHLNRIDSLVFICDMRMFEQSLQWDEYKRVTMAGAESYLWNNHGMLKRIAESYATVFMDSVALGFAERLAERSLTLNEDYGTYLLCAILNKGMNRRTEARNWAVKARDMALKYGWDHSNADQLLKELDPKNH